MDTQEEVKAASPAELVAAYNTLTGKNIKKFENRAKGEARVWAEIVKAKGETPKEKKKRRSMRFRFAPKNLKEFGKPRPGSLRAIVFAMISAPEGALMSEISKATNWEGRTLYEGIRLVHSTTGIGMWHEEENGDLKVRAISDPKEYAQLVGAVKIAENRAA